MAKATPAPIPTPGQAAYLAALKGISKQYKKYAAGEADDETFTTPAKQKKVAKQIANIHNRLNKKVADFNVSDITPDD
jgi:hypothetical protein